MAPSHRPAACRARRAHLVCLALAAALSACAVSQQQEVQLGADEAQQISQQVPLINDIASLQYINTLGQSIARTTTRSDLVWHFAIVDSKEVNAFAVPGGYIYVNRGLIERAQRMDQLAGVIGHEIGHVVLRHSIKQMQQAQGANVGVTLACVLTRVCDNAATAAAINVGGTAVFAKFSRADEHAADYEAVKNTVNTRIDPHGVVEMFQILLAERQTNPSAVDAIFATHPLDEDRVTAATAQIAAYPASALQGLTKDAPAFQTFKRRLASLPPSPAPKVAAGQ
jgi:predicted Zn-dependent protease